MRALVEAGASVNARDIDGGTALHVVREYVSSVPSDWDYAAGSI